METFKDFKDKNNKNAVKQQQNKEKLKEKRAI